ncbi:MAG TPA: ABC transporter substrate-binding protein [Acidimicrobiales bacterium]
MRRSLFAIGLCTALALSACGGDGDDGANAGTTAAPTTTAAAPVTTTVAGTTTAVAAFPVTVKAANGDVTIAKRPTRIVSLAPTPTEMLFAIGAGSQVVAVDDQSNYPANVPKTDLSGFTPNLEAIAGYDPDLVVITNDIDDLVAGMAKLKIPTLLLPAADTLDDTYAELELLGIATGNSDAATKVVAGMEADIETLLARVPSRERPLTYFHELDNTLYTVTSKTFIGQVYALAGLQNIADAADDGSGYPQLSTELIVKENPDLVFLADTKCCGQDATVVAKRPGWNVLKAVNDGGVVELDDDVASRWGPRVVDFLKAVVDAVVKVPAA